MNVNPSLLKNIINFFPSKDIETKNMSHIDEGASRAKRRKIDDGSAHASEQSIAITSHGQLKTLLAFQQSVSQDVKKGTIMDTPTVIFNVLTQRRSTRL